MTERTLNEREKRILNQLRFVRAPKITEFAQNAGRCSLGEAVIALQRLERLGLVERGRCYAGMTWKANQPDLSREQAA